MPLARPKGGSAVMAGRIDPLDSLDFFCTPPWATRALLYDVLVPRGLAQKWMNVWEPAAGEGHMSRVLAEYFQRTYASDVHDYGCGHFIGSFVGQGPDVIDNFGTDWIITNPPFNLAVEFTERALNGCSTSVALLVRSVWAEGADRYERLFRHQPPSYIAQFCERVPMVKGRWDPEASTATSYAWFVWVKEAISTKIYTKFIWIPPGARQRHTKPDDVARFAGG
jgi:hypothetical protein